MFITPYDTTVGRALKQDKILHALKVAFVDEALYSNLYPGNDKLYGIVKQDPTTDYIPPFNHPITVDGKTVVDLRPVAGRIYDRLTDTVKLEMAGASGLLIKQAILQQIWEQGRHERLSSLGDYPLMVYSHWLAETIGRRLSVDHSTLSDLIILSAWFYICLSDDVSGKYGLSDDTAIRQSTRIARIGYRNFEETYDRVTAAGALTDLEAFVTAVKKLGSARLSTLNVPLLLTILSGSWFGGASAKTMIGISLEYPAYFIGMLHTSVTEKAYKNTPITTIALRFNKRDTSTRFDTAVRALIATAME